MCTLNVKRAASSFYAMKRFWGMCKDCFFVVNRIERIDTKDSEERKKLNLVLRNRFDRIVDEQIEEINETVGEGIDLYRS